MSRNRALIGGLSAGAIVAGVAVWGANSIAQGTTEETIAMAEQAGFGHKVVYDTHFMSSKVTRLVGEIGKNACTLTFERKNTGNNPQLITYVSVPGDQSDTQESLPINSNIGNLVNDYHGCFLSEASGDLVPNPEQRAVMSAAVQNTNLSYFTIWENGRVSAGEPDGDVANVCMANVFLGLNSLYTYGVLTRTVGGVTDLVRTVRPITIASTTDAVKDVCASK